jgi:hypothetical protein
MERETIWKLPLLVFDVLKELKKDGLEDLLWSVIGGYPAYYDSLSGELRRESDSVLHLNIIEQYVMQQLRDAHTRIQDSLKDPKMTDVFQIIKQKGFAFEKDLTKYKVVRPSPDKVLYKVQSIYYPANPAIAFVLKHGLESNPVLPPFSEILRLAQQK